MTLFLHYSVLSFFTLGMTVFFTGYPICSPMLVYVVYLGLDADFVPGLVLILIAGFVLDGLSGGVLGVYLFSFLWIFCMIRWLGGFLRATSPFFPFLAVLAGILLENLFTILSLASRTHGEGLFSDAFRFVALQVITAIIICPLLLTLFRKMQGFLFRQTRSKSTLSDFFSGRPM
ncbi:hypothetical protein LZ24_02590 [Desulfobotulus alkaliphilus]|uniref:Rod shape-determining protein MreD n=1 Tax=Desulfobotulus alkaliphilus TaxID=622671 RepID=A0A562RGL0_9BACT|nr:hypothetical protein [Desulfobotulus alkaliphilus]TWI68215.1 hypothetical protein LZ24_02590 [Desulfobotulus alkaliphilus]